METKLNQLMRMLPEGLVVDAEWLGAHGYSSSLRSQYVKAGWLEQPARLVYWRGRGPLRWEQVVISLQMLLGQQLVVGGRTALEMQGFAHYLPQRTSEVHLHGPTYPPAWLQKLPLGERFVYHNSKRLFVSGGDLFEKASGDKPRRGLVSQSWGQWGWHLILSSPERALLEMLDELPERESFEQVDRVVEGLANLSPRRLTQLLGECRSVKVKRLFFLFADRQQHAWWKRVDRSRVDLGEGKRMLVHGGRLNAEYGITVPEGFHAVQ